MEYKIVWTNLAFISLDNNIEILLNNWSEEIVSIFLDNIETFSKQVKNNPLHFPKSTEYPNYRKAVVHKNISIFYRIDEINYLIYINLIWGNKQNPNNLFELLK